MEVESAQLFGLPSLPANHQISGKLPLSSPHPQLIPCLGPLKLQWVSWGRGSFVAWRQCQFAWNGFSLTFPNEPHCASLGFRHLPSGLLTLHFLVPSPAPQAAHSLQSLVMSAPEPWPWGEVGGVAGQGKRTGVNLLRREEKVEGAAISGGVWQEAQGTHSGVTHPSSGWTLQYCWGSAP